LPAAGNARVLARFLEIESGGYDYLLRVVTADLNGYNDFLRNQLLSLGCVDHVETGFTLQRVVDRTELPLGHLSARKR